VLTAVSERDLTVERAHRLIANGRSQVTTLHEHPIRRAARKNFPLD
jgi:hypothetical protein